MWGKTMQLTWLREYRRLVSTLYRSANAYSQVCKSEHLGENVKFSAYEVQIMEHIMEYENQNKNMTWYASQLGLSPSNFSKYVKRLVSKGLVDRYKLQGNGKSIILKVSELGMKEYQAYSDYALKTWFHELFSFLDTLPETEVQDIEKAINIWGSWHTKLITYEEPKLIKIDE